MALGTRQEPEAAQVSFKYRKILKEDFKGYPPLPDGVGSVCHLIRVMPDGQRMALVFYLSKNIGRMEEAKVIKSQKAEVRKRTDDEWQHGPLKDRLRMS